MNMKRMRGRNHRPNGGGGGGGGGFRNQQNGIPLNRNHVFDSSGPEMRVRGTAQQLYDKYTQLARDAASSGDRVTGEAYYQHAEHYFRIISAINQAQGLPNQPVNGQQGEQRTPYQPQQNGQGEYQRRDANGQDNQGNGEYRQQEPRQQESRQQEPRQQEPRQQEPRRFEQRNYEQRPRPEFQRDHREAQPERGNQRYQPEPEIAEQIDISDALEAELTAATAHLMTQEELQLPEPVAESRMIPIIPDAPPVSAEPAAEAPRVPRPRGRPRIIRPVVKEAEDPAS